MKLTVMHYQRTVAKRPKCAGLVVADLQGPKFSGRGNAVKNIFPT